MPPHFAAFVEAASFLAFTEPSGEAYCACWPFSSQLGSVFAWTRRTAITASGGSLGFGYPGYSSPSSPFGDGTSMNPHGR